MVAHLVSQTIMDGSSGPDLVSTDTTMTWTPTSSGTTKTASVSIGPAAADRYVIAITGNSNNTPQGTINSLTIGGVTATLLYSPTTAFCVWGALVPTGTTVNIVASLSIAHPDYLNPLLVYALTGYTSTTPVITETASGTGSASLSASAAPGGISLQVVSAGNVTGTAATFFNLLPQYTPAVIAYDPAARGTLAANAPYRGPGTTYTSSGVPGTVGLRIVNIVWT